MLPFQLPTAPSQEIEIRLNAEGVQELISILSALVRNDTHDHYHLMLGNELTNDVDGGVDLAQMVTLRFEP